MGEVSLDQSACLEEVDSIVIMRFNARSNSKNVGVKNNIRWVETLSYQKVVSPLGDLIFVIRGFCLACFIKPHDHRRRAEPTQDTGLL